MFSCVVKRAVSFKSVLPLLLILLVIVTSPLLLPAGLYIPVIAVGIALAAFFAPKLLFTEYEYSIEGETFSVALIRNKSSRKEIFSADFSSLVTCEPFGGKISGIKVDASVHTDNAYIAVFTEEGKTASVLFTPDNTFLQNLRLLSPSRVKINIL